MKRYVPFRPNCGSSRLHAELIQIFPRANVAFAVRCVQRVLPTIESQTEIQDHEAILNEINAEVTFARNTVLNLPTVKEPYWYPRCADKLRFRHGSRGVDLSVAEAADYTVRAALEVISPSSNPSKVVDNAVSSAVAAYWAADSAFTAVFSPEKPSQYPHHDAHVARLASENADLDWLKTHANKDTVPVQFFERPLWSCSKLPKFTEVDMPTVHVSQHLVQSMLVHCLGAIDNIFISYHHKDEVYRSELESILEKLQWSDPVHNSHEAQNVSVSVGDISPNLPDQYTMRLIKEEHITHATLLIVLVGAETYRRKFIDWEIAAGQEASCAILGLLLPTFVEVYERSMNPKLMPQRLLDLSLSGYAPLHTWDSWLDNQWNLLPATEEVNEQLPASHIEYSPIERAINDAVTRFQRRRPKVNRPKYHRNRHPLK